MEISITIAIIVTLSFFGLICGATMMCSDQYWAKKVGMVILFICFVSVVTTISVYKKQQASSPPTEMSVGF